MNKLAKRRRALMAGSGSNSFSISKLEEGTGLYLSENNTNVLYVYLGLDVNGNARLIRERLLGSARRMDSSKDHLDYDGTELDIWLSNTFPEFLTAKVRAALTNSSRSYIYNNGTSNKTIQRKIAPLTVSERNTGNNGFQQALRTYYGINSTRAMIGKTEGGSEKPYWLMDNPGTNYFRVQFTDGNLNGWPATNATAVWVRPVLAVLESSKVIKKGGNYFFEGV